MRVFNMNIGLEYQHVHDVIRMTSFLEHGWSKSVFDDTQRLGTI